MGLAAVICLTSGCSGTLTVGSGVPQPGGPYGESASGFASVALADLPVKGRAPKTGYERDKFGSAWTDDNAELWGKNGLDTRQDVLSRDLSETTCKSTPPKRAAPHCAVQSGVLNDAYTGKRIEFTRGQATSAAVQIDHVVALSDAWQKGAQALTEEQRTNLANDPLNLIAVDGPINQQKSDSDAASWLPPKSGFRCTYVARQIAVKIKYKLWVTAAESSTMRRVLYNCPNQLLPTAAEAAKKIA